MLMLASEDLLRPWNLLSCSLKLEQQASILKINELEQRNVAIWAEKYIFIFNLKVIVSTREHT